MHKKLRLSSIALVALAAVLACGVGWDSAKGDDAKGRAEDQQAIQHAAASYSAAFGKGDVDGLVSYWSPDAEYIDQSGKVTQGRDAIAALIRKNQENLKGYKMKLQGTGLRFVSPDVALADGKATLVSPDGKEDVTPYTSVWVKSNGKWLVRSLRDLGDDEVKEPATPANHLKPLEPLLGDWVSTDKGTDVRVHCGWTLNKSFMLVDFTVKKDGQESTTAQKYGWDPMNQQIHSWYFDSAGGFGEATCIPGDDGWVAEAVGVLPDGRMGTANNRLRFIDEKSFVFKSRNRAVDGRPLDDVEVHFVRKTGKE
jgi:uncharacterized protein (TIGR02246 family)